MTPTPDAAVFHARLKLNLVNGLGPILTQRLEESLGSAEAICDASVQQLSGVQGIGRKKAEMIRRSLDETDVDRELALIAEFGVNVVSIHDEAYPALLRHIIDPPPLLYVRGTLERTDALGLAIVGSRRCTAYGREQADRMAALGSQAGLTIISGGAYGIDAAAHRATLRVQGRTIAVVGCGLARCYPADHAELFTQIADSGAVVSEFPMTTPPIADNFPRRNRIISGLSLGVLVIEAAQRSGALITARLAAEEHHREVMALPGRVDSAASVGCHKILREGWASLVTSPADVLDALGEAGQTLKAAMTESRGSDASEGTAKEKDHAATEKSSSDCENLPTDTRKVLDAIPCEPLSIDEVCRATGLGVPAVQGHLTQLQLTGHIERLPANQVRRRRG
ncbi:MAG: DNA-processing protein DprA [Phycisphaeraceae bacterium]